MSNTNLKRIIAAGLASGLVLNLIDTPWSVLVMLPKLQAFEAAHGLTSSVFTGPWFILVHFVYMTAVAWLYAVLRDRQGSGLTTAFVAGGLLFTLNRLFGIGNGFLGVLPFDLFWGLTASFFIGTALGSIAAARVIDGGSNQESPR